ncbi:MAG: MMPL family transporter [Candidatus Thalassarchaeaceae archaeon]|nr:MMPL family transporter [Candidatus Thalassarchaeaceae archaeon]MDP6318093.1 MMPL family transporter [Candidatus Thalassarchaeaceae archaeon]DAC33411.1 MAG TPA: hypothetical protein D7H79_05375 [Candidatus Poseidoniales archaeon]HIH80637.1 MMPL family transporter [Candidatus Thalassarchaeaceae archaeon]
MSVDERDDEVIFWERFFERLQPVREAGKKVLTAIDYSPVGDTVDYFDQMLNTASKRGHAIAQRMAEFWYTAILRSPAIITAFVLLVTAYFAQYSVEFEHQIDGDVEVYLPDDAESTDLLKQVRTQWSTDIMILYFQTDNAIDRQCSAGESPPNCRGTENITDVNILQQMSWLESDDLNRGLGGYQSGLDEFKDDRGGFDGVVWVLSPSQIIKETNSSTYRFTCAFEKYGLPTGTRDECNAAQLNPYEGYSIPDDQDRVDNLVSQTEALLSSFVMDTQDHPLLDENGDGDYNNDGDGIWDTGVVILGLKFDMEGTDQKISRPDPKDSNNPPIQDHKAFIEYAETLIFEKSDPGTCELCYRTYSELMSSSISTEVHSMCTKKNSNDPRSECSTPYSDLLKTAKDTASERPQRQAITVTGLTPVVHDVSDAIYKELIETMLPISGLLVCITMMILHRNPKVLLICGTPIAMSLAITFGFTVLADITLTPMIISAGPILVGLGVDYALHLTNRIEENRIELIEERLEESWIMNRDGTGSLDVDPWDPVISLSATVRAALTTGHAIFLSAVTTIIGFSVLTWPSLVPIQPMRTVGVTLLLGIAVTFLLSMVMVPALVHLFRYRKSETGLDMPAIQTVILSVIAGAAATSALIYADTTTIGYSLFFGLFIGGTLLLALESNIWQKIGEIPVKTTLVVLIVTMIITSLAVVILEEEMGKPLTGSSEEVPPGLSSYDTLREYSFIFQGGQTNMFIVNAEARGSVNSTAPIRDLPILDAIDNMQERKINNVPQTSSISIVNILKAVHVDVNLSGLEIYDRSLWELLHDDCWEESTNPLRPECWPYAASSKEDMVNIALDTLSPEIRSMLMNADQDGICQNGLPCETKTLVYVTQPYINLHDATPLRDAIDDHLDGSGDCLDALNCYALGIDNVVNSKLTGGLPVSIDINAGIHKAQSETTIATMFILLFTMMILFRSPRLATFTMAAVAVVVLWQPLLMRQGSVNVNFFTAMIGTIVFGIGVDDSIHIVDRIKDEGETPAGIVKSVARTGQTIFETTATTCAGLAAGLFVAIPGLQNFFVLMMSLLILALLTSSILLPSFIVAWHEIRSRMLGKGPWLDYEDSGALVTSSVLDATLE